VEEFIHGHLEEIDVQDVTTHRVVLDFLDKRKLGDASDIKLHEDIFADGALEKSRDITRIDLKVGRLILVSVDDSGNDTAAAEMLDGIAADIGAGPGGKFDLFCHGITKLRLRRMLLGVIT
jgi:hypothetical protein